MICGRSVVFSQCTPVSSTNKAHRHDIAEILVKVALNQNISESGFKPISPECVPDIPI